MKKGKSSFISPLIKKRLKKFKSIKRGYYSLIILLTLYGLSFLSEFFINSNPLLVYFNNKLYFTAYSDISFKKDLYKAASLTKNDLKNYKFKNTNDKNLILLQKKNDDLEKIKDAFSNSRSLKNLFKQQNNGNWTILPIYPYGPDENLLDELESDNPPTKPDFKHFLGTDDRGRDVFARLTYGFRISMSFALILTFFEFLIGIIKNEQKGRK